MDQNITYYDENASGFYARTKDTDLSWEYDAFVKVLPPSRRVLDAGCGVGRDLLPLAQRGCDVSAFDASQEMVTLAREAAPTVTVTQMSFQDLTANARYDGIWAQLSLIHVPYEETRAVFEKIHACLTDGGIFYATYKYGDSSMASKGRIFWNMTQVTILPYLEGLFEVISLSVVPDTRSRVSPSESAKILQVLVRKL
ncbi:MAG: class I SAM-dependent methyltransferase [Proteobacteria bacterium]|nr:class I SAM-dependent methyltransferase [Pseudomonadota bacterium]